MAKGVGFRLFCYLSFSSFFYFLPMVSPRWWRWWRIGIRSVWPHPTSTTSYLVRAKALRGCVVRFVGSLLILVAGVSTRGSNWLTFLWRFWHILPCWSRTWSGFFNPFDLCGVMLQQTLLQWFINLASRVEWLLRSSKPGTVIAFVGKHVLYY